MATETVFRFDDGSAAGVFVREGTAVDMIVANDWGSVALSFTNPEDMRRLAAMLISEAQELQDRIDIANGDGGDQ